MTMQKFVESMILAVGNMDIKTLEPINHFVFNSLIDKDWLEKIEEVIDYIEENNIPLSNIIDKIHGLSRIRCQLYFLLLNLKSAKFLKEKRLKIANFFYNIILAKAKSDPNGFESNIMHSDEEIKKLLQEKKFQTGNKITARMLAGISSAAYTYVSGLYTDFYLDYSFENYGPYKLEEDKILVIKQFKDLNPKEIWSDLDFPYKDIKIYQIYKEVKFKCDAISCHSVLDGDAINNLVSYRIEANGKEIISSDKLNEILTNLISFSSSQWRKLNALNQEDLKEKCVYIMFYTLKNLFDFLKMDWHPDKILIDKTRKKEFNFEVWNPPKGKEKEYWKKVLDPNIDFYG